MEIVYDAGYAAQTVSVVETDETTGDAWLVGQWPCADLLAAAKVLFDHGWLTEALWLGDRSGMVWAPVTEMFDIPTTLEAAN